MDERDRFPDPVSLLRGEFGEQGEEIELVVRTGRDAQSVAHTSG